MDLCFVPVYGGGACTGDLRQFQDFFDPHDLDVCDPGASGLRSGIILTDRPERAHPQNAQEVYGYRQDPFPDAA